MCPRWFACDHRLLFLTILLPVKKEELTITMGLLRAATLAFFAFNTFQLASAAKVSLWSHCPQLPFRRL